MPPGSTDRVPYATFPFTFAVLAIVRRLWQTSSPSKYPEIVMFAASTLPITLPLRLISKVFESISPLNEPKMIKPSDAFSLPSTLEFSEMRVISCRLDRISPNLCTVDYSSGSSSFKPMPCSWRCLKSLKLVSDYKMDTNIATKKPPPTRKPIGVTAKVSITSLNSHSAGFHSGTIFCGLLRQENRERILTPEGLKFQLMTNDKCE